MSEQQFPKDYYRPPPFKSIPKPHRYATVPANSNTTIFEWTVPNGFIAFVQRIGNALAVDGYWQILFDNMPYLDPKIEFVLGHINAPLLVDPPIKVKQNIKFIYYNEGDKAVFIECLCGGIYGLKKSAWLQEQKVT